MIMDTNMKELSVMFIQHHRLILQLLVFDNTTINPYMIIFTPLIRLNLAMALEVGVLIVTAVTL